MGTPQIDLTAGLVPKSGGAPIDLSAGFKTKAPAEKPEGFWHSFGSVARGILEPPVPGVPMSPDAAASIANTFFTASRQAANPINPDTGVPAVITPEMRNLHFAAAVTAPLGGGALEKMLEQTETGNIKGAAGTAAGAAVPIAVAHRLGSVGMPKAPVSATAPTEALASFIDDRAGAVDPHAIASDIHPVLKNQAALDKLDLTKLEGRAVGQAALKTVGNAVKAHQAEVATITKPYANVMVDQRPIAEAYLSRRTPELIRNDPEAAARLLSEAQKYADVDKAGNIIGAKPAPLSDVNALRIRLNNETAALQGKAEGAFRRTAWESKADVDAVEAAREVQYGNLAKVSGLDEQYIRTLQRREGQLMETRDSLTKEFNKVSSEQAEAVAGSLRANPPGSGRFIAAAREKVGHTYPSRHGAERTILRETIAPHPIETFNNRLKLAFSDLGQGMPPPTYQPVQPVSGGSTPAIQPPTPPGGRLTPAQVATENGFYTQARAELGADAPPAQVQARAQQLKGQQPTLGPGAPGLSGTTRSISVGGKPVGHVTYELSGDTITVHDLGGPQADYNVMSNQLGPRGISELFRQLKAEHPEAKWIQGIRVGGAQGEAALSKRVPIDRLLGRPTLTERVQAQPLPKLRQIQPPRNPVANGPGVRSQGLAGPERAQTIATTMAALKRGEITQQEADRQIQRARGGGSGKLIRMPRSPE